MSKMGDLFITIQEDLEAGLTPQQIADNYKVPLSWVEAAAEQDLEYESDGQPDEAQEWHDYDPDC